MLESARTVIAMSDVDLEQRFIPSWVVIRAVERALGVENVRGIESRSSTTYAVMIERETEDDTNE
jgi:hypothetical protein